jgi:hypothetical protein
MKLNELAYEHAQRLVADRRVVLKGSDHWSEHRPSMRDENGFIHEQEIGELARWSWGIKEEQPADNKGRHRFAYGDLRQCAVAECFWRSHAPGSASTSTSSARRPTCTGCSVR